MWALARPLGCPLFRAPAPSPAAVHRKVASFYAKRASQGRQAGSFCTPVAATAAPVAAAAATACTLGKAAMTVERLSGTGIAASSSAVPIEDRKLRILCLHGYMQNSEIFRSRIGSLRKALKSRAEFFFVDAPYPAAPEAAADEEAADESGGDSGAQGRSWWQWSDLEPGTRPSRAAQYTGWGAAQKAIEEALVQHAPIDGLLGFSQGATAAALFLAHARPGAQAAGQEDGEPGSLQQQQEQQQEEQQRLCSSNECIASAADQLRFAVIIAGFLPRDACYAAALRTGAPALPCLHVFGAADALVPEERSAALWGCFAPGSVQQFKHPGAHMVPTCSGEFKQALVSLLDDAKAGRLLLQQQQQQQQRGQQPVQASLPAVHVEVEEVVAAVGTLACS